MFEKLKGRLLAARVVYAVWFSLAHISLAKNNTSPARLSFHSFAVTPNFLAYSAQSLINSGLSIKSILRFHSVSIVTLVVMV